METDSLDGLLAACAHAGDDPVCVLPDGVVASPRGLGELVSDPIALGAYRFDGLARRSLSRG